MKNFIIYNSKKLKKEPLLKSCATEHGAHCPMDYMVEEICRYTDLDLLVVGIGECAYYSKLIMSSSKKLHWSYRLTDKDLVFGFEKELVQCVNEMFSKSPNRLVVLTTCIPDIANLDIPGYLTDLATQRDIFCLSIPHFKGFSALDSVTAFYSEIIGTADVSECKEDTIAVFRDTQIKLYTDKKTEVFADDVSCAKLKELLKCRYMAVFNIKYLKAVQAFCKEHNRICLDFSGFKSAKVLREQYEVLAMQPEFFEDLEKLEKQVAELNMTVAIKSRYAVEIAKYLSLLGVTTKLIIVDEFTADSFEDVNSLEQDMLIVSDYDVSLQDIDCNADIKFDFSENEMNLRYFYGTERSCYLLKSLCDFVKGEQ